MGFLCDIAESLSDYLRLAWARPTSANHVLWGLTSTSKQNDRQPGGNTQLNQAQKAVVTSSCEPWSLCDRGTGGWTSEWGHKKKKESVQQTFASVPGFKADAVHQLWLP